MIITPVTGATHGGTKPQVYPHGENPPTDPPLQLDEIPPELRARQQWMGTQFEVRSDGKTDKPPYCVRRGRKPVKADKTDPDNWASFEEAVDALMRRDVDAIGYVITEDDPNFVIDCDRVIDPQTGEIDPAVAEIIMEMNTYTEASCSGTGVHIIGRGTKPDYAGCKSKALGLGIEVYDRKRFVVTTGKRIISATTLQSRQDALEMLCERLWAPGPKASRSARQTTEETPSVSLDDAELLKRARRARSGPKFTTLYDHGDTSGYVSASEADLGLINMLIYWTAGDRERIVRLFEGSALYRPKDKDRKYVERSVTFALATYTGKFYKPRSVKRAKSEDAQDPLTPFLRVLRDLPLWCGRKGASAYKLYAGAVIRAAEHGIVDDDGNLRIGSDQRTLAETAGLGQNTVSRSALPYLVQEMGLVGWRRGKGTKAGELVLYNPENIYLNRITKVSSRGDASCITKISTHSPYFSDSTSAQPERVLQMLRLLIRMRRGYSKSAELLRLGMVAMFATIALLAQPKGTPRGYHLEDLAQSTGRRKAELRPVLMRLKAAGIAREVSRGVYRPTDDFAARYEEELERSGITYSERRQRARHKEDRRVRAADLAKRKRGTKTVDDQPNPLLGKDGVARITGGDSVRNVARRKARRDKVRQAVAEATPTKTQYRERKPKWDEWERKRQARRGTPHETPAPPATTPPSRSGPEVMAAWTGHDISDEHPLDCGCVPCTTAVPRYVMPSRER